MKTVADWDEALSAIEADLARFEAVLDDPTRPPVTPRFVATGPLGPVPAEHQVRFEQLAAGYEAAIARAESESARVRAELHRLAKRGPATVGNPRSRIDYQG
jgi:hypothetical protein